MVSNNTETSLSQSTDTTETVADRRELDLSQVADLNLFLESLDDIYEAALEFDRASEVDDSPTPMITSETRKETFEMLQKTRAELETLILKCRNKIASQTGDLDDCQVEHMQQLYDTMIQLRDRICSTCTTAETEVHVVPIGISHNVFCPEETSVTKSSPSQTGIAEKETTDEFLIPDDVQIAALIKRIIRNQFYTKSERAAAIAFCEEFHRAVAEKQPLVALEKNYHTLQTYIDNLERNPDPKQILDRARRILARITAGSATSLETLNTAQSHWKSLQRSSSDPEKSGEDLAEIYKQLERFAQKTESEWLTVCGLHIPAPGTDGVTTARAFREGLMIARDRHRQLLQHPEKQILVDKLIRRLSVIPKEGLNAEIDIPFIIDLVRAIDVPAADQAGGSKRLRTVTEGQSNQHTSHTTHAESFKKRKTMLITSDNAEGELTIGIAKKMDKCIEAENGATQHSVPLSPICQMSRGSVTPKGDEGIIAAIETIDPVNTAVADTLPVIPASETLLAKTSLTEKYLLTKKYQTFIEENYTSLAAFERLLDSIVTQIESKTVDVFERWLGESAVSPFAFFQEQTIRQIFELASHEDVREILRSESIKYETFLAWVDLIGEMQVLVEENLDMTLGELFARWVVESEIRRARTASSTQFTD